VPLREARPDEIARVLRATQLCEDVEHRVALMETPWGREHERLLLGLDPKGEPHTAVLVASLEGALDGRRVRIARLGWPLIITDVVGEDTARELVDMAVEEARRRGHDLAVTLTSRVSISRPPHGFESLPSSEAACRTVLPVPWPKEPRWLAAGEDPLRSVPGLRAAQAGDLDDVASIHQLMVSGQRLRIDRGRPDWERILVARRNVQAPFWVIEREGRVDAYVLLEPEPPTLRWREHGARRGAEGLLTDLFWSALAWARGAQLQRIEGWCLPEILTVQPLYPTSDRARKSGIAVLRGLDDTVPPPAFAREDECRLWELDFL